MARELKLIPHDDGLLALVDDPTWSRDYPGLVRRRIAATMAVLFLVMGLVAGGMYAAGWILEIGLKAGFLVGAFTAAPLILVHPKASLALHIGHVGLSITRAFGTVRTSEVMDGVANTKPARIGPSVKRTRILWEDVDDVVWTDVHLEVRHHGDQVQRFDLEDYARADIARLGEALRSAWETSEPSRPGEEEGEATKEQLRRLAQGRATQPQG